MSYPNSIILSKPFEQVNALVIEPVPGVILRIGQGGILVFAPFLEERRRRVSSSEIGSQSVLKAAAEHHRGLVFLFAPAVQVPVSILPRASKVLANLRVAVGHLSLLPQPLREHPWR